MKTNPIFPKCRLDNPQRRAERDIYTVLAETTRPGWALYEVKVARHAKQVDFLVWVEGVAVFVVQIKGGTYVLDKGELWLITRDGRELQDGLLAEVWDAAMEVQRFLKKILPWGSYMVPVLALPDMDEDEAIRDMAARRSVELLFGMSDWVEGLVALADGHPIRRRPTRRTINEEVEAVMPELAPASSSTPRQVVIQNVESLHIHVGPEALETLGIPDPTPEG